MTTRQIKKLSDAIRESVDASGQTRVAIGRALGISESMMSRFMSGQAALSQDRLDALTEYLGLELVPINRRQRRTNEPSRAGAARRKDR